MPNNESGGSVSTPQSPNFPNNTAENINSSTPINSLPGGSYSAREALLRSGNIPTSLISSFIFPKTPEKRVKETCAITKTRVLASEESQSQLKEKIAKNIGEVEAKKKRQKERERKRKEKERLAKEKEMRKKVKSKRKVQKACDFRKQLNSLALTPEHEESFSSPESPSKITLTTSFSANYRNVSTTSKFQKSP